MKKINFTWFLPLLLTSVLHSYEPEIDMNPPDYVNDMPSKDFVPEFSRPGSLFGQGERPLFADRRAMRVDDLITVKVKENINNDFKIDKKYSGSSGGNITPPLLTYNGQDSTQQANTQYLNDQVNYTLSKPNNATSFQGGGTYSQAQNLAFTLTARILKVMENGNYFIYGKQEMLVNGEKQILQISGVIRPYDIQRDNTIESQYISDSKISLVSVGKISDTITKKPTTDSVESSWPY
ncbi:flagellar basal body L-ring protein FlgH [Helicobacter muridarum]|uniref:Flagellar L-ring protein n=1 Tax=Helicobacter muridarum TaxID=216 RepID=A0A099TWM6_9HELI|nr:flagellar basal body L-ring protein FlgH [Helicobacter muridarum]TLD99551.1 flagellar basal body L-ring protein FlgH [Helicobacter muridarum]STQ85886.1 flagellar basal body L-ring protein [Helicobacter muridarum]